MTKALLIDKKDLQTDIAIGILKYIGIEAFVTDSGYEALKQQNEFDIYLIGADLTDMSGFRVCKEIRANTDNPIIMLTYNNDDSLKFIAYESGADRLIEKPFNEADFELAIRSMLRISYPKRGQSEIEASGIKIDLESRIVISNGTKIKLTQTEYMVLEYMIRNKNKAVSRIDLIEHVWGFEQCMPTSTVNVHMKNLRDKLGTDSIETIRGYGYRLNE